MRYKLFVLGLSILFCSCSEYQRVLKDEDISAKFKMGTELYENGKFDKANRIFLQIVPKYRGKPQAEKLMFMYADTYYKLEDYYLSGYQFERFAASYPKSDSVETAAYYSASSYYELSPVYSLDQKDTYTGLEKLQAFIDTYPNSEYRKEANKKVKELTYKLQKKDIEVAKQYLKTGLALNSYKNSITAFENFISDHPGSIFREDAYFGRFQAQYELALQSVPKKVEDRLQIAIEYFNDFMKYYGQSELAEKAKEIKKDIDKKIETIKVSS